MYSAGTTPGSDEEPPPRMALRCPSKDHDHAAIVVRDEWFFCESCSKLDGEWPRYYFVRDEKHDRLIAHPEFRECWGSYVYSDGER